jgi:hypothetical protein
VTTNTVGFLEGICRVPLFSASLQPLCHDSCSESTAIFL